MSAEWEELTVQQKCSRLVYETLEAATFPIETVANIGASMDVVSAFLAEQLQGTEFVSVDFQDSLEADNTAVLAERDNWSFLSGYALNLLREGELTPDLVFFTSTSVLFRNEELNAYLDELTDVAKVMVFNESWYPRTLSSDGFKVIPPEDIDPWDPYVGGPHSNYHHNYIHKLNKRGFNVCLARIMPNPGDDYHVLQLVAYDTNIGT